MPMTGNRMKQKSNVFFRFVDSSCVCVRNSLFWRWFQGALDCLKKLTQPIYRFIIIIHDNDDDHHGYHQADDHWSTITDNRNVLTLCNIWFALVSLSSCVFRINSFFLFRKIEFKIEIDEDDTGTADDAPRSPQSLGLFGLLALFQMSNASKAKLRQVNNHPRSNRSSWRSPMIMTVDAEDGGRRKYIWVRW